MLYALWNQLAVLIAKAKARLLEGALVGGVNAKRHRANWEIKHICHVFICTYHYNSHMNFEMQNCCCGMQILYNSLQDEFISFHSSKRFFKAFLKESYVWVPHGVEVERWHWNPRVSGSIPDAGNFEKLFSG